MKFVANLSFISLALLALSFIDETHGKSAHILDDGADALDIPSIAKIVCNPGKKYRQQISRISTVSKLADYFRSIPVDHELAQCGLKYGPALKQLQLVVSSHNENVCSEEKVSLIADFHKSYVSTVRKHKDHQLEMQLVAPEILKTFFIQYASEVSSICERFATDLVQRAALEVNMDTEEKARELEQLDEAVNDLSKKLLIDDVKRYKDIYQPWTLVENLALEKNNKFSRYLSDGPTKIAISMNDAKNFYKTRDHCLNQQKPIYSKSSLPLLQLIGMGYYPQSTQYLTELETNSLAKRMYVMTQYCEIMLAIKVIENEALAPEQVVMLTQAEVGELVEPGNSGEPVHIDLDTSANSLVGVDKLEPITSEDAVSLAKQIKNQIKHRSGIIKKMFTVLLKVLKNNTKSMSLQTSEDGANIAEQLESSIPQLERENLDELYEDDETHNLVRRKRGFFSAIKRAIVFVFVAILYFILHIVIYKGTYYLTLGIVGFVYYVFVWPFKALFGKSKHKIGDKPHYNLKSY